MIPDYRFFVTEGQKKKEITVYLVISFFTSYICQLRETLLGGTSLGSVCDS